MSNRFRFQAVRSDGSLSSGLLRADGREQAREMIVQLGEYPVLIEEDGRPWRRSSPDDRDLALGLRALADLLRAGIAVGRAVELLDGLAPTSWGPAMPAIRARVAQGDPVSGALGTDDLAIPPHVVGVIAAGEAGSGLADAVARAAELLAEREQVRSDLRNALSYPLMLGVIGGASVSFLIGVVLPRFADLLADQAETVPITTGIALKLGGVVSAAVAPSLAFLAAAWIIHRRWLGKPGNRARWHGFLLSTPVVGPIRFGYGAARISASLGALLEAELPLAQSLTCVAPSAGDECLSARLAKARERVVEGSTLSTALAREKALTATVIKLVQIGERTGRTGAMLREASRLEQDHALRSVQRLIRAVEPMVVLGLGLVVLFVAAALLQAMYGLRPAL